MTRTVKETIRRGLTIGIAATILGLSGLVGSASGQDTLAFSDNAPVSLAVSSNNDKLGTATNGSSNTSEIPANVTVVAPTRPNVALLNSVMPSGVQPTGTDLVFTVAFTNSGGQAAQVFAVVDPIPAETDFKLDSASTVLGTTGMTVVVEYSNNDKMTWTYAPVSGGGGALEGYDRSVTHVRWRFSGSLSQTFPDNAGSVAVTARIR